MCETIKTRSSSVTQLCDLEWCHQIIQTIQIFVFFDNYLYKRRFWKVLFQQLNNRDINIKLLHKSLGSWWWSKVNFVAAYYEYVEVWTCNDCFSFQHFREEIDMILLTPFESSVNFWKWNFMAHWQLHFIGFFFQNWTLQLNRDSRRIGL